MSTLFAATCPERTVALVLFGTLARGSPTEDYPHGNAKDPRTVRRRSLTFEIAWI